RLDKSVALHESPARTMMGMRGRFGQRQYRSETDIVRLEQFAPLIAGFLLECLLQEGTQLRPSCLVLSFRQCCRIEPEQLHEPGIEPAFNGSNRDVFSIRRLIDAVPWRAAVDCVGATLILPGPGRQARVEY